ncbi:MAG TPA: ABC transporter permease [Thermomicrobiales bacterium]|jgi:peptide/nickel transport system permease protein|nr:ABC transporter permease [Thermomicrobiales bacterium]
MATVQPAVDTAGKNQEPIGPKVVSQRQRSWRAFKRNKPALFGAVLIFLIVLVAIFAPLIAPDDPLTQSTRNRLQGLGGDNLLGTDPYGRDVLSRIIYGTRVALRVGVLSVALGAVIGTIIGVSAAYFGGIIDTLLMRLVDVLLSFPDLITGLLVMAVLGAGEFKLIIAIGLTVAPRFARISYGPVLGLKEKEFVEAARAIGQSTPRILNRHILPNIAGELVVLGSLWTASAIRLEASLSFIGLGVPPPTPTWGQMIRDGTVYLADMPWLSLAPGLALLITVFAFNLVGDGLRDILDPRAQ